MNRTERVVTTTAARQSPNLLKLALIILVVVLSLGPMLIGLESFILTVALLTAGVACVVLFVRQPAFGLAALILTNLVVPTTLSTGTNTPLPVSLPLVLILALLWLGGLLRSDSIRLPSSRTVLPLAIFAAVAVLSFGMGQLPWYRHLAGAPMTAQLAGLGVVLISAVTFMVASDQIREMVWLERLTWLFLGLNIIHMGAWMIPGTERVLRTLISHGSVGSMMWTWLVALAFGQAIFNNKLRTATRVVLLALVVGTFYIHVFRGRTWVSGWLPALVAVVTILWFARPRLGTAAAIGAGVFIALNWTEVSGTMLQGNQYSLETRLAAWEILLDMVRVNPLFGLGPANYYAYAPQFPILGFSVRFSSHNNYIDLIAQYGLVGLTSFLWFMGAVTVVALRLKTRVREGFPRAYLHGAIGGIVGTLVAGMLGDWILPFAYNVGLGGMRSSLFAWLFMGGLVALEQIERRANESSQENDLAETPLALRAARQHG